MVNDVVLKGIVANIWRYAVVLLFRLACYGHLDLPSKLLNEIQDAIDFIVLQVPQRNLSIWVHGSLQSWDHKESLVDFVKDGHGTELMVLEKINPSELQVPPGTSEVVARRIMSQVNGSRW